MKTVLCCLFFSCFVGTIFGQIDSVADWHPKLAQINFEKSYPSDTLTGFYQKMDSVRHQFNAEAQNIDNEYRIALSRIDSAAWELNTSIDSLQRLRLPANKYRPKLDSINRLRIQTLNKFTTRTDALKEVTKDKLKALELPPEYDKQFQQFVQKVEGFNLQDNFIKIPEIDISGIQFLVPQKVEIGPLEIGAIDRVGRIGTIPDITVPKTESSFASLGQISENVKPYQEDIKNIAEGNVCDLKTIPETIEAQVGKLEHVQELQKQSGIMGEYQDQLTHPNDSAALKKMMADMVRKAAIDHFAGKGEHLRTAMNKMAKYKEKYSSASSIKDLPKRPANSMKGKPLIERLVPGFYFQYQQKTFHLVDFNPYVGYKVSGKFTAGAGWNERIAFDRAARYSSEIRRIFGPRVYVDFRLRNVLTGHIVAETMNTFVPSVLAGNPEIGSREWVWGIMTGMKKEFNICGNLRGTVLMQYNLFNPEYKAPYIDRLNSRIGLEYFIVKKHKK